MVIAHGLGVCLIAPTGATSTLAWLLGLGLRLALALPFAIWRRVGVGITASAALLQHGTLSITVAHLPLALEGAGDAVEKVLAGVVSMSFFVSVKVCNQCLQCEP